MVGLRLECLLRFFSLAVYAAFYLVLGACFVDYDA